MNYYITDVEKKIYEVLFILTTFTIPEINKFWETYF